MSKNFRLDLLDGHQVQQLIGREMALGDDGSEWTHPSVPCLQFREVYFCLEEGRTVSLSAFYNDYGAEFLLEDCQPPELCQGEPEDIFRTRVLDEFEGGLLRSVKVEEEDDGVEVWHIQLGQTKIVLVAGEVHPDWGGYVLRRPDESVLLFSPPDRLHLVEWNR